MHRLMIVDDSNVIRRKIERSRDVSRYLVVGSASNGREAVESFGQWRPTVVTMDLTMPQMDGLACIPALIEMNPEVRILVVSALSDKATGIEALNRGARGFLLKPFTDEQLIEALNELMGEGDE